MLPSDLAIFAPSPRPIIPWWAQARTKGLPGWAAQLWASSFSWWGKRRSAPPPWMSAPLGRCFSTIAEHSMCHPGRPGPHGLSHEGSPGLDAFQSVKSSGLLLKPVFPFSVSLISSGRCPERAP